MGGRTDGWTNKKPVEPITSHPHKQKIFFNEFETDWWSEASVILVKYEISGGVVVLCCFLHKSDHGMKPGQ
jgi:hypothetical protein